VKIGVYIISVYAISEQTMVGDLTTFALFIYIYIYIYIDICHAYVVIEMAV